MLLNKWQFYAKPRFYCLLALYLLEQRPLGGAVLYDLKNRRNLLWSAIKRHAGPVSGNLMLVVGDPPNGSRFPEKYASKLGIERWVHASKLAWHAYSY